MEKDPGECLPLRASWESARHNLLYALVVTVGKWVNVTYVSHATFSYNPKLYISVT